MTGIWNDLHLNLDGMAADLEHALVGAEKLACDERGEAQTVARAVLANLKLVAGSLAAALSACDEQQTLAALEARWRLDKAHAEEMMR